MTDMPAPSLGWKMIASGDEGPGPRSRHCLVHDLAAKTTVLFSGLLWVGNGHCLSDTWELRNGGWSRADSFPNPPARHRGAMIHDSRRGSSVLFGGQGNWGGLFGDTWTYADARWHRHKVWWWNRPAARCGHAFAFEEETGAAVLFGGIGRFDRSLADTWLFEDGSWRRIHGRAPRPRRYAAFAYDPDLKGCVLHGGAADDAGKRRFGDV